MDEQSRQDLGIGAMLIICYYQCESQTYLQIKTIYVRRFQHQPYSFNITLNSK